MEAGQQVDWPCGVLACTADDKCRGTSVQQQASRACFANKQVFAWSADRKIGDLSD